MTTPSSDPVAGEGHDLDVDGLTIPVDVCGPSLGPRPRLPGDSKTEEQRRMRVVHGWSFRALTDAEIVEVSEYLEGGPVPAGYAHLHEVIR